MTRKKVTTHDISVSLGLSRNTVSKALNDHPSISEATKQKVIETAMAMGYKKIKLPDAAQLSRNSKTTKTISFLTAKKETFSDGYWMNVMQGVEEVTSDNGYEIMFSFIKHEDISSLVLPQSIANSTVDGFIVAGSITKEYNETLMKVNLPKVFIDIHSDVSFADLRTDVVLMESEQSVYQLTGHLIEQGHRDIGFIGDVLNCRSFMERWLGFKRAMEDAHLPVNTDYCLIGENPSSYHNYSDLAELLEKMNRLPTAFVCANDMIALNVIKFLTDNGMKVPKDAAVAGFDNNKQSELLNLSLTTVHNDEYALGRRAMEELLWRMQNPDRPYELVRISTKPLIRESTGTNKKRQPV